MIVSVYNVEKYLSECIDSILNNTYEDFELILVDDGSTDGSGDICDEYALKDDRIKVLHNNNMGLSAARNCGIRCAKGEYISFVDSDDYVDDTMFAKLISKIVENDLDVVKCGYYNVCDGVIIGTQKYKNDGIYENSTAIALSMKGVYFTVVWNAIYRKELVEKVMFPEGLVNEDIYFSAMVLYYTKRMVFVDESLYFYRFNPNSITKREVKESTSLDVLITLSMLHEELNLKGLKDVWHI